MKQFVFLYPIKEYIDYEINNGKQSFWAEKCDERDKEYLHRFNTAKTKNERKKIRKKALQEMNSSFRKFYSDILNACIDERYRKNGFDICYIIFNGSPISDIINFHQTDKVIEVELDFKTHTTPQPNGGYNYPNPDYVLNQLSEAKIIRIAGFHLWDCIQRFAETSYRRGLNTLVDKDLTELFKGRILDTSFKVDKYPTLNPRKGGSQLFFELFMKARENRPWMWQDY